jgi:hypothetical protein
MMNELRRILGHSEETVHMIDWVQDAWQTYDVLIERVGRERAYQIINSIDLFPAAIIQSDLTAYDHTNEPTDECLLN